MTHRIMTDRDAVDLRAASHGFVFLRHAPEPSERAILEAPMAARSPSECARYDDLRRDFSLSSAHLPALLGVVGVHWPEFYSCTPSEWYWRMSTPGMCLGDSPFPTGGYDPALDCDSDHHTCWYGPFRSATSAADDLLGSLGAAS